MTSDDELERRLRALKGGATDSAQAGATSAAGSAGTGARAPVLEGEVIEPPPGPSRGRSGRERTDPGAGARDGTVGRDEAPRGAATRVVAWSLSEGAVGRLGLWLGVALVGIGAYYVLAAFFPGIRVLGSLGVALLGVLLVAAGLTGRAGGWARSFGTLLIGFGVLPFIAGVLGQGSNGWGSLGAGLALLVLALLRRRAGRGFGWQGAAGIVISIWGAWGVLGGLVPGFPTLGDLIVPVILLLIGLRFVRRGVAPGRER